jgi:hypothetical protein
MSAQDQLGFGSFATLRMTVRRSTYRRFTYRRSTYRRPTYRRCIHGRFAYRNPPLGGAHGF